MQIPACRSCCDGVFGGFRKGAVPISTPVYFNPYCMGSPKRHSFWNPSILVLATLVVMTLRFRLRHLESNQASNVLSAGRLMVFETHPLNADYKGVYGTVSQQLTRKWKMK